MITRKVQKKLLEGIQDRAPVGGLTHNFYRYPARFSPAFARAVIEAFTEPGDLVYDPFVGGGTTLVEAAALRRRSAGTDLSSLAVFVSKAKTTLISPEDAKHLERWIAALLPHLNVLRPPMNVRRWMELGYTRNMNSPGTWRLRNLIGVAIERLDLLDSKTQKQFARCILLKTAQWALDCRSDIPRANDFRNQLHKNALEMLSAIRIFAATVPPDYEHKLAPICLHRSAIGIDRDAEFPRSVPLKLVLTSPPYPGVHVLYHRWQIMGRRETPAPFWVTSTMDGAGGAFYTFGDRKQSDLTGYFDKATAAFRSIAGIANPKTIIVQMVAFSEPSWQLPRYLEAMRGAGLSEVRVPLLAHDAAGRVWRGVPNRRWYASQRGDISASREVVLFHRLRQQR